MSKWYWMGDNGWAPFDAAKTKILETDFNKGSKKIAIDKERYVDLSLSHAEVYIFCFIALFCIGC